MVTSENEPAIREAVGIFFNADHLRDALKELLASGFGPDELGGGVVGALAAMMIHQSDAEYLQQQVDEVPTRSGVPAPAFPPPLKFAAAQSRSVYANAQPRPQPKRTFVEKRKDHSAT